MKKVKLTIAAVLLVLLVSGCGGGKTAGSSSSTAVSEASVQENSVIASQSDEESEDESSVDEESLVTESDEESSEISSESSYTEESSAIESSAADDAEKTSVTKEDITQYFNFFIDKNLKEVDTYFIDTYGKDYIQDNFEYFDCVNGDSILLKKNWTIRSWKLEEDGKIHFGCEKTASGLASLNNALDTLIDSKAYQAVSKITDVVGTLREIKDILD